MRTELDRLIGLLDQRRVKAAGSTSVTAPQPDWRTYANEAPGYVLEGDQDWIWQTFGNADTPDSRLRGMTVAQWLNARVASLAPAAKSFGDLVSQLGRDLRAAGGAPTAQEIGIDRKLEHLRTVHNTMDGGVLLTKPWDVIDREVVRFPEWVRDDTWSPLPEQAKNEILMRKNELYWRLIGLAQPIIANMSIEDGAKWLNDNVEFFYYNIDFWVKEVAAAIVARGRIEMQYGESASDILGANPVFRDQEQYARIQEKLAKLREQNK